MFRLSLVGHHHTRTSDQFQTWSNGPPRGKFNSGSFFPLFLDSLLICFLLLFSSRVETRTTPNKCSIRTEQNIIYCITFTSHKKNALAVSCLCQPTSRNVFCISSLGSESDPKSVPFLQHGPCLVICFDGL